MFHLKQPGITIYKVSIILFMKKFSLLLVALLTTLLVGATPGRMQCFADESAGKAPARDKGHVMNRAGDISAEKDRVATMLERSVQQHRRMRVAPVNGLPVSPDVIPDSTIEIDIAKTGEFYDASVTKIKLDGNKISIENFGNRGVTVTGEVNLETGAVTIPRQTGYNSPTYGNCDIVSFDVDLNVYNGDDPIPGQLDENGVLTLESWVLLITDGEYKNYSLGSAVKSSTFRAPNAMMSTVEIQEDGNDVEKKFALYCEQTATNRIDVYNFLGAGYKWQVSVNADKTMSALPQFLFSDSRYGSFFYYDYDLENKMLYFYRPITGTAVDKCLSWGPAIINSNDGKVYAGKFRSSKIDLSFDIKYPVGPTQAGFKGSGTETDPYLIETLADLMALSDSVNYNTNIPEGAKYAKAFEGKYFKQTKAINAKDVYFPPIGGSDGLYRFAGIYDGGNKAISNLTVDTGAKGYAGLFGCVDTIGVVKNVTLTAPDVRSIGYYYTGTVAGECMGTLDNCKVTNGKVVGTLVVGGVAASAGPATNCSFTGEIIGESQVGGVFAVTRNPCSFLSATNTRITLTGTTEQIQMGGVVGTLTYHRGGSISDSYFSGELVMTRSSQFAGGIVGAATNVTIDRCFSLAKITSKVNAGSAMGGICGAAVSTVISDCYFAGENMVRSSMSGGILGYMVNAPATGYLDKCILNRCYITGLVYPSSEREYNPYVGYYDTRTGGTTPELNNCYYDAQMLPVLKVKNGAKPSLDFTGETPNLEGYSADVWEFTKGLYPRIKSIAKNDAAYVSAAALSFDNDRENVETLSKSFTGNVANSVKWNILVDGKNSIDGHGLTLDQKTGVFSLNGSFATDTITAYKGTVNKYFYVRLAPDNLFEGAGSEAEPYLLKTKADLLRLSDATVNSKLSFNGTYFKITNDIDMENDPAYKGIGAPGSAGSTYGFGGVLDGGDHYIHNLKMIMCDVDDSGAITAAGKANTQYGFVNNLKVTGVVRNVRIAADCEFVFYSRGAAVVGYNYGGLIENCRNYATVKGYSGTIGGITSYNGTSKNSPAIVRNCYNAGKIVTGYQFAGGIAANNYGLIENCQNAGEVTGELLSTNYEAVKINTAGGIAHTSFGKVSNVLNTGNVHIGKYAGGILGWFNNKGGFIMEAAVNVGMVDYDANEEGTVGNLVGKMYQEGTIADSYYDKQLSLYGAAHDKDHEGANGLTTAALTSGEPLEGLNPDLWNFRKGEYPSLKAFADEDGAIFGASAVVFFGDNIDREEITTDCPLSTANDVKWTLTSAATTAFTIVDGNTLSMDPAEVLADTVVASCKGFVKYIPVAATPAKLPAPVLTFEDEYRIALFACEVPGVTFYYTLDGDVPTTSSASSEGRVELPAGENIVTVIAAKHNYYNSEAVSERVVTSGVDAPVTLKKIVSRVYVTPAGITSSTPVQGVNLVVTTYEDGTRTIEKKQCK